MPVFEYQCNDCNKKYEVYHKSVNKTEEVNCPVCNSGNSKKLLSSFSASVSQSHSESCNGGSCGIQQSGGCSSGMCGLN
jgi:putative regulatory protein, FmdB family